MKSITYFLDELKKISGSDYASAKLLGVRQSTITTIRKRKGISDELGLKVAKILGVSEQEMLLALAANRSEGKIREVWEKISRDLGIISCLVFVFYGFFGFEAEKTVSHNAY